MARVTQRKIRCVAFAEWLKSARIRAGKSQAQAAQETNITQQEWSRMEREGAIPYEEWLNRICQAVGCPTSEALNIIQGQVTSDRRVSEYDVRYRTYKQTLIEREKPDNAVGVFIIRDDPEPVDYIAVQEYLSVLQATTSTWFTLLFRYPSPKVWQSYHLLMAAITQKLGDNSNSLGHRLRAFYRKPDYAESAEIGLPMAHPYLLTCDNSGLDLASAVFDQYIKQQEIAAGYDEPVAAQRSLCILNHDRHTATQIAQWIGLASSVEPLSHLWFPVPMLG